MTTLFNLFCPLVSFFSISSSVVFMVLIILLTSTFFLKKVLILNPFSFTRSLTESLFPLTGTLTNFYFSMFLLMGLLNLISLVAYSYPVTTTLAFNLSAAFMLWFMSILMLIIKTSNVSLLVPANSPWYLIAFLSLVEMVSIVVRPVTLCFRLLANMSAGHILLSLISKLPLGAWILGSLFGLLELMVALVQSFVFLMLVSVYYEEAMSHFLFSFWNLTLKKLRISMMNLETLMFMALAIFTLNFLWKWSKTLLIIISMEAATVFIMVSLMLETSGYYFFLFIMFTFFVSEALIILSSLYSALRSSGSINSSLLLF